MKRINKIASGILGLLGIFLLTTSCENMNDIQSKYADMKEEIYLGKVDSINVYPGLSRAKITWYISADPKIERTIIYWNMRKDSIVRDFVRASPGVQKDSIIVENLPEGTQLFEFRNINSKGNTSLYSSASVISWGERFANRLISRSITSQVYDLNALTFKLNISNTFSGDSVVYSQVRFTNGHGVENNIRINRVTNTLTLTDFPRGGEFQFRTAFFLPKQGIDTIFNTYKIYKAPM
jgi:hypothetical protein